MNGTKKPCCYFYFDAYGKLAYVGKANGSLVDRVRSHAHEGRFTEYSPTYTIKYLEFDTEADMDVAELAFIKSMNPPLNIQGKTYGYFPRFDIDLGGLKTYTPEKRLDDDCCSESFAELKKEVLRILERHDGRMTYRDISRLISGSGKYPNRKLGEIWDALTELEELGFIRCKTTGNYRNGSPAFLITLAD